MVSITGIVVHTGYESKREREAEMQGLIVEEIARQRRAEINVAGRRRLPAPRRRSTGVGLLPVGLKRTGR